jgi:GNAT superfamily N-acetyltransferase
MRKTVGPEVAPLTRMDLANDLIESDRTYFERGARLVPLPGATLTHMPAFRSVAAASAVHRIDPHAILPDPLTWVVAVETIVADLGLSRSRFFVDRHAPELDLALTMLGYRCRMEYGLFRRARAVTSSIELVPVTSDEDWSRKLSVHSVMEDGPDGFALDPTHWVGFEKAKQAAGYYTLYLAMQDGVACGALGLHTSGRLLRLKNLVVAPAHRRRGVGAAILDAAATMAHTQGLAGVGCFVMPGELGDTFYRANGFTDLVTQSGWDRVLTAHVPARLAHRRVHAYS